jgi:hypothetical protein
MPRTVLRVGFEAERRQVRFLLGAPSISRQSPNANPVGDELTRLHRCLQYIVGVIPTGKDNFR